MRTIFAALAFAAAPALAMPLVDGGKPDSIPRPEASIDAEDALEEAEFETDDEVEFEADDEVEFEADDEVEGENKGKRPEWAGTKGGPDWKGTGRKGKGKGKAKGARGERDGPPARGPKGPKGDGTCDRHEHGEGPHKGKGHSKARGKGHSKANFAR